MFKAITFLVLGLACISPAHSEIYSWTDDAGNPHFSDKAETIPEKYRKKAAVEDDAIPRNWEYLASEYGAEYYYDASNVVYTNRNRYLVKIKESYASSGREEYESQIMFDCARFLYKTIQAVRISNKQRTAVPAWGGEAGGYRDGFQQFTYPYQVLSRIICKDSRR